MIRGWEVELDDGSIIQEDVFKNWNKVPKNRIVRLTLRFDGREWNILGKDTFLQKKRGSSAPFVPDSFKIESRSIGYYEGSAKVWYTVNENTGNMKLEMEDTNV